MCVLLFYYVLFYCSTYLIKTPYYILLYVLLHILHSSLSKPLVTPNIVSMPVANVVEIHDYNDATTQT